jgi:hypothetical protein
MTMAVARAQHLTEAEYLRIERAAPFKSEFLDGAEPSDGIF